jgi:hypothetical protein
MEQKLTPSERAAYRRLALAARKVKKLEQQRRRKARKGVRHAR